MERRKRVKYRKNHKRKRVKYRVKCRKNQKSTSTGIREGSVGKGRCSAGTKSWEDAIPATRLPYEFAMDKKLSLVKSPGRIVTSHIVEEADSNSRYRNTGLFA